MLTKKQATLLKYVIAHQESNGVTPSFEEMREALGLKSKSGVHAYIEQLVARGYLRRMPSRARALEVMRRPLEEETLTAHSVVSIPFFGRIAAGLPVHAFRSEHRHIDIHVGLLQSAGISVRRMEDVEKFFALEIVGDSMKNAGILDGDTVIIEWTEVLAPGEIGVALIDQEEVTLKRIFVDKHQIELIAENPQFRTQIYEPHRVKIQGRVVALVRQYPEKFGPR